jgi:hypothetical protein
MIIAVFGVLTALYFAIHLGSHLLTRAMVRGSKPLAKSITAGLGNAVTSTAVGGPPGGRDRSRAPLLQSLNGGETNEITCSGYFMIPGGRAVVFLTDGRIADSRDGEVQRIYKRKVEVFGGSFPIRRREPEYVPAQQFSVNLPANGGVLDQEVTREVRSPVVAVIPNRSPNQGRQNFNQTSVQSRMGQSMSGMLQPGIGGQ